MEKKVRVTIEASNPFIKMLSTKNLEAAVEAYRDGKELPRQLSPTEILGMLFLAEAIGIDDKEIRAMTPAKWRGQIEVVSGERRVYDDQGNLMATEEPGPD